MIIRKLSPFSGKVNEMDLPVKESQFTAWNNGTPIQYAFPNLTADQREFLISGTMPNEWNEIFGKDDDND